MDLTDNEKYFIAHFVLGTYSYVKPNCGKYISLFSYLDQTDESIEVQKRQIDEDDWYFSELLEKIYKESNEAVWKSVFSELERKGFFENEDFYNKFLTVATWLYSKNSLRYFFEAGKEAKDIYIKLNDIQKIKDAENEKRNRVVSYYSMNLKSEEELAKDRANAMKLLNKPTRHVKAENQNASQANDWGLKHRPKIDGDGNDWREQV